MNKLGKMGWPPRWRSWPGKGLGSWGRSKGPLSSKVMDLGGDSLDRLGPLGANDYGWQRGNGRWNHGRSPQVPRLAYQTLGAVMVFFAVLGVFQLQAPWAVKLQEQVYRAATEDMDYEPVRQAMVRLGMWTDSTAAVPVIAMGGAGSVSGRAGLQVDVPTHGVVTRHYGWQKGAGQEEFSPGVLIAAAKGSPVVTPMEGKVNGVREDAELGRVVEVLWKDGRTCLFGHLEEVAVKAGQSVTAGEVVGQVGTAGKGGDPVLYWELRQGDRTVDPLNWQGKAGKTDAGGSGLGSSPSRQ